jgi:hypothetical protein
MANGGLACLFAQAHPQPPWVGAQTLARGRGLENRSTRRADCAAPIVREPDDLSRSPPSFCPNVSDAIVAYRRRGYTEIPTPLP